MRAGACFPSALARPPRLTSVAPLPPSSAVRNKSAAFYQFSNNADVRARQQAELAAARAETEAARRDVDVPEPAAAAKGKERAQPPDAAGAPPPPPPKQFGGKASEKRKRELDERRAMLEERKRRKEVDGLLKGFETELGQQSATAPSPPTPPSLG